MDGEIDIEYRAIELYIDEELPHDRPWSAISESTRDGYRQQARHEEELKEKRHSNGT